LAGAARSAGAGWAWAPSPPRPLQDQRGRETAGISDGRRLGLPIAGNGLIEGAAQGWWRRDGWLGSRGRSGWHRIRRPTTGEAIALVGGLIAGAALLFSYIRDRIRFARELGRLEQQVAENEKGLERLRCETEKQEQDLKEFIAGKLDSLRDALQADFRARIAEHTHGDGR